MPQDTVDKKKLIVIKILNSHLAWTNIKLNFGYSQLGAVGRELIDQKLYAESSN